MKTKNSKLTSVKTQSVENGAYNISSKPGDKLFLWDSLAIAFSSGVDSTFLLKAAREALGDNVTAVTAQSCSFPERELNESIKFCRENKTYYLQIGGA